MNRGLTTIETITTVIVIACLSFVVYQTIVHSGSTGNTTGTDSSLQSTAIPGQDIPDPTQYVNDTANVMSSQASIDLETELEQYAKSGKGEIAVLTVPNMHGLSIEEFGIRVGEKWKVGKYGVDNGEILILAMQEHKARIETGSGSKITDAQAEQILLQHVIPHMKAGDVDAAITDGVHAIESATN